MLLHKNIIVRSLPYHYRSAILLHYNRPCPPQTAWYLNHFSLTSLVLLQEKSNEGRRDMDPKGRQNFWYMQITPILPIILFYLGQNIETFHSGVLAILESCETDILEKCGNPLTGYVQGVYIFRVPSSYSQFVCRNLTILNELQDCQSAAETFIHSKRISYECLSFLFPGFRSCASASLTNEEGCNCINSIPNTLVDRVKVYFCLGF